MTKKMIIISPKNKTLYNFRGDLIKSIINEGYEVIVIGPNKDNIEEVLKLGVSFKEVPLKKDKVSILADLEYYKGLKKILKEEKPDIVFSYTIKPVIYGSLAARKCKIKNVYAMITGLGRLYASKSLKTKILRYASNFLYKNALKGCKKVIFQNNDDLNQLVTSGILSKEKTVKVDGSGVNIEKFKFTKNPLNNTFIMVSRIIKEKGVIEYLKAAEIVKKKHPNSKFILLGGYDNSIGALTKNDIKYYLENNIVEIPGETSDVVPYYKKSMVFVLPSYYKEGLPRTILEALSVGRPVITTDWTGCREAIRNNKNGFLIEIKNHEELAKKMIYLIENHNIVEKMSNYGYELCKEIYDVRIINNKMMKIMGIIND